MLIATLRYFASRLRHNKIQWLGDGAIFEKHSYSAYTKISILIPTRDKVDLLKKCVDSITQNTLYPDFEIIILDNSSTEPETLEYFRELRTHGVQVLDASGNFNFSKIINKGVNKTTGEFVCVLNNDTVVTSPNWLRNMAAHLSDPKVGLVGAFLKFENNTIQHAGIALGYKGIAGHVFRGFQVVDLPMESCFEVSAVTFACALTRRSTWNQLGGLDEKFKVGLNDVDFCLRLKKLGLKSVLCVDAELIHLESKSRKSMTSVAGGFRAASEIFRFLRKYGADSGADVYFKEVTERSDLLRI